jgi:Xaa-Pro aminopeptidase
MHEELKDSAPLSPVTGLVEDLRLIKDAGEIAALERSCALNHAVMASLGDQLAPGQSESEIAWSIEQAFRNKGASELAFSPIVAVNQNAALPHAIPGGDRVRENSPVLVDVGARYGDYCSDQTRTFWIGDKVSSQFQQTMERVREAQDTAIKAMRPGLPIAEAYRLARDSFERHGVADHFTHALGHGIGLETHEAPSVGPLAKGELKPGMVVTVEPGLYYPEWGGIRWEYMVLVTEDGARTL